MFRRSLFAILTLALGAVPQGQQPVIQNGRVEVRQTTAIDRELSGLNSGEPVWAAWRVPIVAGRRGGCCVYNDDAIAPNGIRGCFVDGPAITGASGLPQVDPARGALPALQALPIEAGSGLVLLLRLVNGRVERMRTVGDDCPLDAGGRTVYWLQGVTPAESLRFLDGLVRQTGAAALAEEPRLRDAALSAAAMHADAGADVILDRVATADADNGQRRLARTLLRSARGAHGFIMLRRLLEAERFPDIRRQLVGALGQTREAGAADVFLALARNDTDPRIRAEAVYWLPQRAGAQGTRDALAIVNDDAADIVMQRGVQGLARASTGDPTTTLLELARTSQKPMVKKEAVAALGRSRDPRALQFLEGLLK